tara:strand:+ start:1126 stop:1548 length:423 start_codon:yes stop_codon:yes gene_type:complete
MIFNMKSLTGKLGLYQDDISSLPTLDITRYERIFKIHTASKDDKQFYFYNILNKIEFPDNLQYDLLELYTAPSDEPLTTVSYNLYGDIDSWWLIYLLNKSTIGNSFFLKGGTQVQVIRPALRSMVYESITEATAFGNRHF